MREPPPELLIPAEMGKADEATIASGISGIALMENAGRAVARAVARRFAPCRTLVLCGPGNNGGTGYVTARRLGEMGWPVAVAALAAPRAGTDGALAAARWRGPHADFSPTAAARAELVIDAVFGAGRPRPVEGSAADGALGAARLVAAVDVPSGGPGGERGSAGLRA